MLDKKRNWLGGKSAWEWLQVVGVPLGIAIGVTVFGLLQSQFAENREDTRLEQSTAAQEEAAREDALQGYLDSMTILILQHGLKESAPEAPVRGVARAKTLTVLRQLDGLRKGLVLQFLQEARLIGDYAEREALSPDTAPVLAPSVKTAAGPGIVNLDGADLRGAILTDLELANVYFGQVDLRDADLRHTGFEYSNFCEYHGPVHCSNFSGADMRDAQYFRTRFGNSKFRGANLSGSGLCSAFGGQPECSDFNGADFTDANLERTVLLGVRGAIWMNTTCPDGTSSRDQDGDGFTCLNNLVMSGFYPVPTARP